MKTQLIKTVLSVAIMAATSATWAAGTTAGTDINNTASITYSVGGNAQTPIESSEAGNSTPGNGNGSATTFKVDKKIDLSVTPATTVNVTPNSSGALTFQVTNEGNSVEDFAFNISEIAGGDFDATGCTAAPANINSLAVDTPTNVVVTCNIPNSGVNTANNGGVANAGTVANTKTSVIDLLASVTGVTESTGADTAAVDVVFADNTGTATDGADRNAKHSATGTYVVNTADISVAKTSAVTKMSINGADVAGTGVDAPKRIPGSTIEYTITVSNAASAGAPATGIVITDAVPANMTYVACSFSGSGITGCGLSGSDVKSTPDPAGFTLAPGESATMVIEATLHGFFITN